MDQLRSRPFINTLDRLFVHRFLLILYCISVAATGYPAIQRYVRLRFIFDALEHRGYVATTRTTGLLDLDEQLHH
jgi:hypothetical protein